MKLRYQWFYSVTLGLRVTLIIGATGARIWTGKGGVKALASWAGPFGARAYGAQAFGTQVFGEPLYLPVGALDERISILSKHELYSKGVRSNVEVLF